ncbi:MAG: hypothetical protein IJI59_11190 [Clostridia bacterium]|nr:hypothetical protein [Clostridia bacterium]
MSTHIIENERLRISVADLGAELTAVYDKARQAERLWNADPAVWNRHAPILFPFVGKVMDGKYRIGDREYAMKTQHGFARDLPFACVGQTDASVTHVLTADDWTRERYPYEFRLTVTHALEENRLRVAWTVENRGDGRMYFSIGGHPGYMPPRGARKEDCFIAFPGAGELRCISASPAGYALPGQKSIEPADGLAR